VRQMQYLGIYIYIYILILYVYYEIKSQVRICWADLHFTCSAIRRSKRVVNCCSEFSWAKQNLQKKKKCLSLAVLRLDWCSFLSTLCGKKGIMHGDEGKEMIMILNLETSFVQDAFLTHCLFMPRVELCQRTTQSKSLNC
jgi:hypothetical protein